jgi:hypothetical protein
MLPDVTKDGEEPTAKALRMGLLNNFGGDRV